jgi:hypothetical protein
MNDVLPKLLDLSGVRPRVLDRGVNTLYRTMRPPLPEPNPEWDRCEADRVYFMQTCCSIYWKDEQIWKLPAPWPCQSETLRLLETERRLLVLKARQQGFTWVALADLLWRMVFKPVQQALLFSKGDREAQELTGFRLEGMISRLPEFITRRVKPERLTAHEVCLDNGSRVISLPSTAGHSYSATFLLVDEADYCPDLPRLMTASAPTVDAGGTLVMLSTSNKAEPESLFKKMYRSASKGENGFRSVFYGWNSHPGRTPEWYQSERQSCFSETGSYDRIAEAYPSSPEEALAPRSLDKRLPFDWVMGCYQPMQPLGQDQLWLSHLDAPPVEGEDMVQAPSIPGLRVYKLPEPGLKYVIGADPAAGNPNSDDSAACVIDEGSGEQVAMLSGRIDTAAFASYIEALSRWYNGAPCLCERTGLGIAVLNELRDHTRVSLLSGEDRRPGWSASMGTKAISWSNTSKRLRFKNCIIHDETTFHQLCQIDGSTCKAPEGAKDDCADSFNLALAACDLSPRGEWRIYCGPTGD